MEFSVALDNNITVYDGFSSTVVFQTVLFEATNLPDTMHTMTVTNQEKNSTLTFFDLDFVGPYYPSNYPGAHL